MMKKLAHHDYMLFGASFEQGTPFIALVAKMH